MMPSSHDVYSKTMHFSIDKIGQIAVFQPVGQINSANAAALESDFMAQFEKGERKIVLDLEHLSYISSAGLRLFLLLAKKLKQANGALVICNVQSNVLEVLEITGFLSILAVCDTRSEALARLA